VLICVSNSGLSDDGNSCSGRDDQRRSQVKDNLVIGISRSLNIADSCAVSIQNNVLNLVNSAQTASDPSGRLTDVTNECEVITVDNMPTSSRAAIFRFPAKGTITSMPTLATLASGRGWLVYALVAQDGDGQVVARNVKTGKEWRHPRGKDPVLSADGAHLAFAIVPAKADLDKAISLDPNYASADFAVAFYANIKEPPAKQFRPAEIYALRPIKKEWSSAYPR